MHVRKDLPGPRTRQQWIHPASVIHVCTTCGRNLVTQPTVKDVQPLVMSSIDNNAQHEQAWMDTVHANLHLELETDTVTPIMWSAFHASRSDAVGHPEKCKPSYHYSTRKQLHLE